MHMYITAPSKHDKSSHDESSRPKIHPCPCGLESSFDRISGSIFMHVV